MTWTVVSETESPPSEERTPGRWRNRGRRSGKERLGLGMLLIFVLIAILGPELAPDDPSRNTSTILSPPNLSHWLGTTQTGQDVLSQLLIGTRSSIVVAVASAAVATMISIIIGISSGYLGPFASEILSAITNVFLVIPALPLAIVIAAYLPSRGNLAVAFVVALTGWAWGARSLRAQTLSLRRRDFITSARLAGEGRLRIVLFEILPNVIPIVVSSFLFTVLYAIITQASLAFLGLVNTSTWSWGTMLYWIQNFQAFTLGAWWWYIPPGLCIALFGTALSLVSFGVDERINPRLRAAWRPRAKLMLVGRRASRSDIPHFTRRPADPA